MVKCISNVSVGGKPVKYPIQARWWLTSVVLATQETEIMRITVRSQPWTNSSRDPILKIPNRKQGW
jgi:hypothetical protein